MTSFRGKLVDFLVFWRNLLAIAMDLLCKSEVSGDMGRIWAYALHFRKLVGAYAIGNSGRDARVRPAIMGLLQMLQNDYNSRTKS